MDIPGSLIKSLQNVGGFDEAAFKAVHTPGSQVTSIRLNPAKIKGNASLVFPEIIDEKIPWTTDGYYLKERPSFTLDPLFHAGAYYVQEASSMFLEQALLQSVDLSQPLRVLDLCGAPGGKSTLIQSLISDESLLVSNEVIKTRVNILSENITKWGAANVIVTNNDPKDFKKLPGYFDVIVVDAPCSGSGLFRKDPGAIEEWSEQNVTMCSQRQQRILADILPSLKPGGILIYSTCSYSTEEDEAIADWLVEENNFSSIQLKTEKDWNIIETNSAVHNAYGYRFYPDKVKGEGFYIACFVKPNDNEESNVKSKGRSERISNTELQILKSFVKDIDAYFFIRQNEEILGLPIHLEKDLAIIQSGLYIKKAGIKLGSLIRNELIPNHELALSNIFTYNTSFEEVNKETALQYLRRQDISIDTTQRGWMLLTYQHLPLGWIKVLANRINNYYPKEWRILNK